MDRHIFMASVISLFIIWNRIRMKLDIHKFGMYIISAILATMLFMSQYMFGGAEWNTKMNNRKTENIVEIK